MELLTPTECLVLLLLKALLVRVEGALRKGRYPRDGGHLRSALPSAAVVFTPPVRLEDLAAGIGALRRMLVASNPWMGDTADSP